MLYYKFDCVNNISSDLPEDVIGVEIDQKSLSSAYEISLEKIQEEFTRINLERRRDSSNNYGKKYIKGYIHKKELGDVVPTIIRLDSSKEWWESPNLEAVLLLKENYTYRDTWLLQGDSWCLYILSADTLLNVHTGEKAGGVTFTVTPHPSIGNYYAPLLIIASVYIEENFVWEWWAKKVAVAHEIGHTFQLLRHECWDRFCIMYHTLEDPPAERFCINCEGMFCDYYLPKRYGSFGPRTKRN